MTTLDPRQVVGKRTACRATFLRTVAPQHRVGLLLFGLALRNRQFEIFQCQVELVGIELFQAPAELQSWKVAKQLAQSLVLAGELVTLLDQPSVLGPLGIALSPSRQHQGPQRSNVVGQSVGHRHARDYIPRRLLLIRRQRWAQPNNGNSGVWKADLPS